MKKIFASAIVTLGIVLGGMAFAAQPAAALTVFEGCKGNNDAAVCKAQGDTVGGTVKNVINILLYVIGIISVVMIVVGGVMYSLSEGDSGNTKKAKDTIVYAVIGLVIASLAYTIVNFVLDRL